MPRFVDRSRVGSKLHYRYLVNKRGIRRDVVDFFVNRGDIYQDVRGQIVFKGRDEQGRMKYAHVRSLTDPDMKKDVSGSEKAYSFRYCQLNL